ncbi:MAG: serine hydrolase [Gemmatimonadaceae bacterium]|nr:serine hydrolase [Gemmatimonadaceae bacterium]
MNTSIVRPARSAIGPATVSALLLLAPLPAPLSSQAPAPAAGTTHTTASLRSLLEARVALGRNPAIVAAQISPSGTVTAMVGRAGSPDGAATSATTRFEIGSITKAVTGVLFAEALARGEVREDDRLVDALPGLRLPPEGDRITLLDLATHRSGLPSFPEGHMPANASDPWADVDSAVVWRSLANTTALRFSPGTKSEYSNVGAGLLGQVLVRRAGAESFETLVRDRIARPLQLAEFGVQTSPDDVAAFAQGHDDDGPSARWHLDYLASAGAIVSTLQDMTAFAAACLGKAPQPLATYIAEAQRPRRDFAPHRIGLHWIATTVPSGVVHWHNGGTGGFRSFLGCNRATGYAAVVLTNSTTSIDDLGLHLIDAALPLRPPPAARVTAPTVAVDARVLDELVGTYRLSPAFAITVTREGNGLVAQATNQQKLSLLAESPSRWRVRGVEAALEFERDASGTVIAVVLVQGGARQRGLRATP